MDAMCLVQERFSSFLVSDFVGWVNFYFLSDTTKQGWFKHIMININ